MAGVTNAEVLAAVQALPSAIADALATVFAANGAAPASAPAKAEVASPFVADAPEGEKMVTTRKANLAAKVAGKFCDGHGAHAAHGFVHAKTVCPRDGKAL